MLLLIINNNNNNELLLIDYYNNSESAEYKVSRAEIWYVLYLSAVRVLLVMLLLLASHPGPCEKYSEDGGLLTVTRNLRLLLL